MPVKKFIWDIQNDSVLMETDENDVPTVVYTNDPDGNLISQRRGSTTSYYHYDGLGSTTALTDDTGAVTDTYSYTAFGETVTATGTTENPFRYIGERGYYFNSKTEDYYVRERVYEPKTARWLSRDSVGGADGPNGYWYALNNPVILIDPSGRISQTILPDRKQLLEGSGVCRDPILSKMNVKFEYLLEKIHDPPGGYIVQQVEFTCRIALCEHCPIGIDTPEQEFKVVFYEAFRITGSKTKKQGLIDKVSGNCLTGACGYQEQKADARFFLFNDVQADINNPSKWTHDAVGDFTVYGADENCWISPGTGEIHTSDTPTWWDTKWKKNRERRARRTSVIDFYCCTTLCLDPWDFCSAKLTARPRP